MPIITLYRLSISYDIFDLESFYVNIICISNLCILISPPYIVMKGSIMFTTARERRRRRRRFIVDRINNVRSRNAQWYPVKRQDIL